MHEKIWKAEKNAWTFITTIKCCIGWTETIS